MKRKANIDWTLDLKCDHWVWPWSLEGQIFNLLDMTKWFDGHKMKKEPIEWTLGLTVAISFDLGYDLDLGFSRERERD